MVISSHRHSKTTILIIKPKAFLKLNPLVEVSSPYCKSYHILGGLGGKLIGE